MPVVCRYCGERLPALLQAIGYCNSRCEKEYRAIVTIPRRVDDETKQCLRCEKQIKVGVYCEPCREYNRKAAVAKPRSEQRNAPQVAPEIGKSSGRPGKWMCYGNGDNANGLWDNLVEAMENAADAEPE